MNLHTSSTQKGLNVKMKIAGLEALDLIFSLIMCAVLNLFFGDTTIGRVLAFTIPLFFLICLYFGKRGKPDDYLKHLIKFYITSGHHSASEQSINELKMRRKIYENETQYSS